MHKSMLVNVSLRKNILTFFQPKLDSCDIFLYIYDNVMKWKRKEQDVLLDLVASWPKIYKILFNHTARRSMSPTQLVPLTISRILA